MTIEEVPCNHDFLDPATTVVVRPDTREAWCISCSKVRALLPMNDASRAAAIAARQAMLFGGDTRGNN